jgi:hypothetical protein
MCSNISTETHAVEAPGGDVEIVHVAGDDREIRQSTFHRLGIDKLFLGARVRNAGDA